MIYLLEDDAEIRELVVYALSEIGLQAEGFDRPSALYAAIQKEIPSLLLLDVMLPEEDGFAVLKRLRTSGATATVPIIMLTARDGEYDKVAALNAGADDYITKPFGIMELSARIRAVLRRTERKDTAGDYSADGLALSVSRHRVTLDGSEIALTCKEFELLTYLFENRGVVLSRDKILQKIWGYDFDGENRTVDVHIRTLRQKLGKCGDLIETVRGFGYRIGG